MKTKKSPDLRSALLNLVEEEREIYIFWAIIYVCDLFLFSLFLRS